MTPNDVTQNNRQHDWLPEVLGAHPWIDMDDGQRRAHEKTDDICSCSNRNGN